MQNLSRFTMVGCFLVALIGCDDGGDSGDDTTTPKGGSGGGGAPNMAVGKQVTWTNTGWIGENEFDITGSWYSYDDCNDAMGLPCTVRDAGLTGPDSKSGWTVTGEGETGKVCAKGVAAKVENGEYGKQWGFGIAFDMNNPGAGAVKGPYNAPSYSVTGFSFTIQGSAPATIRINLPNAEIDTATHFREVKVSPTPTAYQVVFSDTLNFKQGSWVARDTPNLVKAFDPTKIYAAQFQVFTKIEGPTPFDFCVSDFRVITGPGGGGGSGGSPGSGGRTGSGGAAGGSGGVAGATTGGSGGVAGATTGGSGGVAGATTGGSGGVAGATTGGSGGVAGGSGGVAGASTGGGSSGGAAAGGTGGVAGGGA